MKPLIIASLLTLLSSSAFADVSELSQADLRAAISEDRAIPTRALVAGVERFTGGEVLDIRAFTEGADVVYRILYRAEDGSVGTLLVDGGTGRAVAAESAMGQAIASFVGANPGNGNNNGNAFGRNNGQNGVGNGRNNGNNGRDNNNRGGSGGGGGGGNGRDR